jgi:hypothetical protein
MSGIGGLPITVEVSGNGSVFIDGRGRQVGMSRFSERAQRLAKFFGEGETVIATFANAQDLPGSVWLDVCEVLR